MHWLLLLLIIIPALEIGMFIWVGSMIGGWWVVFLIILTGFMGISLAKRQGLETWKNAQQSMYAGQAPKEHIFDGICIFIGAIFLFAPGFITDMIGLLLIIPWTRKPFKLIVMTWLIKRISKGNIIYRK